MLRICSVPVRDYRDGLRHVMKLPLENVSTGWIRFAIAVDHRSNHSSQGVEKPLANVGSQVPHLCFAEVKFQFHTSLLY